MEKSERIQKTVDCGILGIKPIYRFSKEHCERTGHDNSREQYVVVFNSSEWSDERTINVVDLETKEEDSFCLNEKYPNLRDWLEPVYEANSIDKFVELVEQAGGVVHRIDEYRAEICLLLDIESKGRSGLKICIVDNYRCDETYLNFTKTDNYGKKIDECRYTIVEFWNLIKNELFIPFGRYTMHLNYPNC